VSKNERQEVLRALDAWDRSVFREVTSYQSPLLDRALPALTTAADRSVIWLVVAAGLAATGRRRQRRAAVRGVSSVAVTSLLVNQLAKRLVPRPRPVTPGMPNRRPQRRVPRSPSFPSGHAASAAAFAVGAIIELPALAVPLGALAGAVGYSGIYAGIHYPGDVLAGAIAGAGIAFAGARLAPAREPTRVRPPDPVIEQLAPCPSGAGVVAVVNPRSGSGGKGIIQRSRVICRSQRNLVPVSAAFSAPSPPTRSCSARSNVNPVSDVARPCAPSARTPLGA
jgi:undecaprenyl-diphosphatase